MIKVEVKFEIGSTIYYLRGDAIRKAKVTGINIRKMDNGEIFRLYEVNGGEIFYEEHLFSSPEELSVALLDRFNGNAGSQ